MIVSIIQDWRKKRHKFQMGNSRYQGQTECYSEWKDWNEQRIKAEQEGKDFKTPPPSPPIEPSDDS